MPGGYAHITLVNILTEPDRLDSILALTNDEKKNLMQLLKYIELGAVSPDYPYLKITDKKAQVWADNMHYERTGEMIQVGTKLVRDLTGAARYICLAWLFGYCAHVVMDVTVHPIVALKVGEYQANKKAHRICEMNQDTYIYQKRLNGSGISFAHHLESGIGLCGENANKDQLDKGIANLWDEMLKEVYPEDYKAFPPDINGWHRGFRRVVDLASTASGQLMAFARHVAVDCGVTYPTFDEIDQQFIKSLATPSGPKDYDEVFDLAIENVSQAWQIIADGLIQKNNTYLTWIGDWNLDTGRDNKLVFWS